MEGNCSKIRKHSGNVVIFHSSRQIVVRKSRQLRLILQLRYKIEWSEFHFVLIFGLTGFFLFWTFLLLR